MQRQKRLQPIVEVSKRGRLDLMQVARSARKRPHIARETEARCVYLDVWVAKCQPPNRSIVQALSIDPVWFGVMFLICMQLGLLLPPHGLLLMTMRGVAPPSVTMAHIFIAVAPYVVMSLILLAAVFWIPEIATRLPKLIG
jgi:hypothetical protein